DSVLSRIWSPRVVMPSSCTARPKRSCSRARTCSACHSARRLSRVAVVNVSSMSGLWSPPVSIAIGNSVTKSEETMPRLKADDAAEKNRPLVEDIRLLGRILGDVIREQEGKEAFELIERVRQLSVAYRLKRDASAGRVLDRLLKNLTGDQ